MIIKKLSGLFRLRNNLGFSLIELMIVVAIVAVLAAVAIPAYMGYLRRSYISEATSAISAIKSAEESYFSIQSCYINTVAHPGNQPQGGNKEVWDPAPASWAALAVRPDKQVRFQYRVYASNDYAAGGCGTGRNNTDVPALGCVTTAAITGSLIPASIFPNHWYIIHVTGDLKTSGNTISSFVSAIDDSAIIECDPTE